MGTEWVDTAFMHALACAFGVTVLVFQDGVDSAVLGQHQIDGDDGDCDLVVPVALVTDYHFWARSQAKPVHHGSGTRASRWPSKPRMYILGLLGQRSPR